MKVALVAMAGLLAAAPMYAADTAPEGVVFSGEVTPKLYSFDYLKGADASNTQYLERYNYQRGMGGDNRSGSYLDLDLNIVGTDGKRDVFVLERQGFGAYNHRGKVKADSDRLGFTGYYSSFRTATGGLGFLYSPNQVTGGTDPSYFFPAGTNTNSGYVAQFNNDSPGQSLFNIDRTTYGAGLALKPELSGTTAAAAFNYDGYKRDGNRFAGYVLGGSDVTGGATRVLQRWRGFDMPVDERMNRYTLNLGGAPGGFAISYEGSLEKFDNKAKDHTVADFAPFGGGLIVASTKPIHFVPDSTLVSNNIRLAKNFGSTAVATGYGLSVLDQDSFTTNQQTLGYDTGKITTSSAYLNVSSNALSGVGLEGFVKYNKRDNDSSYPTIGLIDATADQQLGVRINSIKSLGYGLAAAFRVAPLKSTMTVGWKHEDKDRDLTFHQVSIAPAMNGIAAERSLYTDATKSDELYLKVVSRPTAGVTVRVTPFYQVADRTGMVTEPEKSVGLKAKVSYVAPRGMLVSGYYDYRNKKNTNNTLSGNAAGSLVPIGTVTQETSKKLQAAGVSLSLKPSEWINTMASLSWNRDDFSTYYFRSDRRRFEAPTAALNFLNADQPNYEIDTYVFSIGGDWQVSEDLSCNGSYIVSRSKGSVASGLIQSALPAIDGDIDNSVNTLVLGADYQISKSLKLKGSYAYDHYKDKIYSSLTGAYHTLMLGVSLGF